MKAQHTTTVFIVTLLVTMVAGVFDELVVDAAQRGDNFFTVITLFGLLGCIISFFTALVAAFKADVPEPIMEPDVLEIHHDKEDEDKTHKLLRNRPGTGC